METVRAARQMQPKNRPESDLLAPAVVLTYADLADLSSIIGRNIGVKDPSAIKGELFNCVGELTTISVEGVPVTLEPRLLQRLKSRCLDKPNFDKWLREVVIKQLHDFCGW
jgi:hypothetical protein